MHQILCPGAVTRDARQHVNDSQVSARPLEELVGKNLWGCVRSGLGWNKDGMLKHVARLRLGISRQTLGADLSKTHAAIDPLLQGFGQGRGGFRIAHRALPNV